MKVNLEIRDADMTFPLRLFILRGEDIPVIFISIFSPSLPHTQKVDLLYFNNRVSTPIRKQKVIKR